MVKELRINKQQIAFLSLFLPDKFDDNHNLTIFVLYDLQHKKAIQTPCIPVKGTHNKMPKRETH